MPLAMFSFYILGIFFVYSIHVWIAEEKFSGMVFNLREKYSLKMSCVVVARPHSGGRKKETGVRGSEGTPCEPNRTARGPHTI